MSLTWQPLFVCERLESEYTTVKNTIQRLVLKCLLGNTRQLEAECELCDRRANNTTVKHLAAPVDMSTTQAALTRLLCWLALAPTVVFLILETQVRSVIKGRLRVYNAVDLFVMTAFYHVTLEVMLSLTASWAGVQPRSLASVNSRRYACFLADSVRYGVRGATKLCPS